MLSCRLISISSWYPKLQDASSREVLFMRKQFLEKLYQEYRTYKRSVLSCPRSEIFNRCYEIDAIVNFYEILSGKAETMSDRELETLLGHKDILMEMYALWLDKSDSAYSDMEEHVDEEIQYFMESPKR